MDASSSSSIISPLPPALKQPISLSLSLSLFSALLVRGKLLPSQRVSHFYRIDLGITVTMMKMKRLSCFSPYPFPLLSSSSSLFLSLLLLSAITITSYAFESDELLVDDEEFGLEGGRPPPLSHSQQTPRDPHAYNTPPSPIPPTFTTRKKFSDPDSDSKIHFTLEHAFGDSDFVPAGTFSARLKTLHNSRLTLTKLRFTRNAFTNADKENFEILLQGDDFYRIRLPSNVLGPPGRDFVISSVKARCLTLGNFDEHFVIHVDGVNILAVNYGAPVACPYPRQMKHRTKWSFNSHAILKTGEQAPRTPLFAESTLGGENGEDEGVKPPERSFWAKYWMYLIPLGLIVMNAMTQAMNMPEEQPTGQAGATVQRGPSSAARRR